MARILVVDDEPRMRHLLAIMLGRQGHSVEQAGDGEEALALIAASAFDMVITDIKMPRLDGLGLLKRLLQQEYPPPVVFITAFATVEQAVEAMRQGAVDYITKPFEEDRIVLAVERTLGISRLLKENRDLRKELQNAGAAPAASAAGPIVYASPRMAAVMDLAAAVAPTDAVVRLSGESGTGKELLARHIHASSPRAAGRFVPLNCAAIPAGLIESELFGHERGAFTGAVQRGIGKFEYARGGTLFLDEIADLSLEAQARLLRALQEKTIQRVGGNDEIAVDVRFICATNQDLEARVREGKFREDLFFRINVFPIELPPLRERGEDVVLLAEHFLRRLEGGAERTRFTAGALRVLKEYPWPGNVRELANAVERALILSRGSGSITSETLSFLAPARPAPPAAAGLRLPPGGISLEEVEKELVRQALEASRNNQLAAARILGLTRAKFRVLLRRTKKEE